MKKGLFPRPWKRCFLKDPGKTFFSRAFFEDTGKGRFPRPWKKCHFLKGGEDPEKYHK